MAPTLTTKSLTRRPAPLRRVSPKLARPAPVVVRDSQLTVEQWDALPDTKPRYELISGRLKQKMTTLRKHTMVAGNLLFECMLWARISGWRFFSEGTGVYINEVNGYVPDVVGFTPDFPLNPNASYEAAPFLVCEVLSNSTARRDRTEKKAGYASAGVQLYIIIDPDAQTFEVYRPTAPGSFGKPEVLTSDAVWQPSELPGLKLELARLWF